MASCNDRQLFVSDYANCTMSGIVSFNLIILITIQIKLPEISFLTIWKLLNSCSSHLLDRHNQCPTSGGQSRSRSSVLSLVSVNFNQAWTTNTREKKWFHQILRKQSFSTILSLPYHQRSQHLKINASISKYLFITHCASNILLIFNLFQFFIYTVTSFHSAFF